MDIRELKDKITTEDIIRIMDELGVPKINSDDEEIIKYQTVCHCGDSFKLYFYKENKNFHCYTGCGSQDVFELIKNIKGITLNESIKWVKDFLGLKSFATFKYGFNNENNDMDFLTFKTKKKELKEPVFKILDFNILERFHRMYHPLFYKDNIAFKTMDKYGIRYDISNQRIIIPHFDSLGNLIAIRCRNTNLDLINNGMKYIPIKIGKDLLSAPISDYLYGLNFNIENIKKCKKIILFESEKSVMQVDGYVKDNIAVALCSSNLSDWQIKMLEDLGIEEVILAMDKEYHNYGDEEYKIHMKKMQKSKIDRLKNKFEVSLMLDVIGCLGYKDSPSDKGKDIFFNLLNNRIKVR